MASILAPLLVTLGTVAYVGALAAFVLHFVRRSGNERASRVAEVLLLVGALAHGMSIAEQAAKLGFCPMKTLALGVSSGTVITVLAYLATRRWLRIFGVGVFIAPIALVSMIWGRLGASTLPTTQSEMLPVHITVNVLGDGFFLLASGAAALYLIQERSLKAKKGGAVFGRLPAIDSLDSASSRFLLFGFLFLSAGTLTGTMWLLHEAPVSLHGWLRASFGYASWILVGAVLALRAWLGWRGRRAAYGTLVGFACALVVLALYWQHGAGR